MTIKTRAEAFSAENVTKFRTFDVVNGEVTLSDSEYIDVLNEDYGDVEVCGNTFGSGDILVDLDPTAFRGMKGDYEGVIQTELEDQLEREDGSNIEFEIDPDDLEDEE